MFIELIELLYLFASIWMTAVIWFVQLVHYPTFKFVPIEKMISFSEFHQHSISFIVMPAMMLELLSCSYLVFHSDFSLPISLQLLLIILIWIATFTLSVPCHQKLITKPDYKSVTKLINTNWIRTILWTTKLFLFLLFFLNNFFDFA